MKIATLLLCLLAVAAAAEEPRPRAVNPKATPEARRLLDFLYAIQGKHTLSGQHNFIMSGSRFTEKVHELTGKRPLLWGSDFSFAYKGEEPFKFQHCGPLNLTEPGTKPAFTDLTPEAARDAAGEERHPGAPRRPHRDADVARLPSGDGRRVRREGHLDAGGPAVAGVVERAHHGRDEGQHRLEGPGRRHRGLPEAAPGGQGARALAPVPRDERGLVLVVQQEGRQRLQEAVGHDVRALRQAPPARQPDLGLEHQRPAGPARTTRRGPTRTSGRAWSTWTCWRPTSTATTGSSPTTTTS